MKKLILLAAVLFGTAVASQAGVHVDVGIGLPFPPIPFPGRVIISRPAPVYVEREYCPPPVVYVPAPRYYSYPSPRWGCSEWGYRGGYDHGRDYHGHDSHGGGHGGHGGPRR